MIAQDSTIQLMLEAAREAARAAIGMRSEAKLDAQLKSDRTWVTAADHEAQRLIHETLAHLPGITFIGEEAPPEILQAWIDGGKKGKAWVIDPIDGTYAFKQDNEQQWSVSLALQDDGQTTHAVLYRAAPFDQNPDRLKGDYFIAKRGEGAFIGSDAGEGVVFRSLRLPEALPQKVCIGYFPADGADCIAHPGEAHKKTYAHFAGRNYAINNSYCATVGMLGVADGTLASYVHAMHKPWDSAATTLVMSEAGAIVRETQDAHDPQYTMVMASPIEALLDDLTANLHECGVIPAAGAARTQG